MVVVKALLTRIIRALPSNNALGDDPSDDPIFVQSCETIAKIAQFDLELVLGQLILHLKHLHQNATGDTRNSRILLSEVLLLRIIVRCSIRCLCPPHASESAEPLERYVQQANQIARVWSAKSETFRLSEATVNSMLDVALIHYSADDDRPESASSVKSWSPDKSQRPDLERRLTMMRHARDDVSPFQQERDSLVSMLIATASLGQGFVVLDRITKLMPLADTQRGMPEAMQILAHVVFDRKLLASALDRIAFLLPRLLKTTRVTILVHLHAAICHWMSHRPRELSELYQARESVAQGAEKLFLLGFELTDSSRRKEQLWPVLATFLMLCPDTILAAMTNRISPKAQFLEAIRNTQVRGSKLMPAAIASWSNILHALDNVLPEHRQFLSGFSNDRITNLLLNKQGITDSVDRGLFSQPARLLTALYRMKHEQAALGLIAEWLSSDQASQLAVAAVLTLGEIAQGDKMKLIQHQAVLSRIPTLFIRCTATFASEFGSSTARVERKSEDQLLLDRQLCLTIARVLRQFPTMVCLYSTNEQLPEMAVAILANFLYSNDAEIATVSAALLTSLLSKDCLQRLVTRLGPEEAIRRWGKLSLTTLLWLSKMLTGRKHQTEETRKMLALLKTCLDSRYEALLAHQQHLGSDQDIAEHRAIQMSLKMMVFMLLCHYDLDIQMQATRATLWVLREKEIYENMTASFTTEATPEQPNNVAMFNDLARIQFVTQGRNAVQRVIKRSLRTCQITPATVHVWSGAADRFKRLGAAVLAPDAPFGAEIPQIGFQEANQRLEWQTLLGILLSLSHALQGVRDCTPTVPEFLAQLPRFLFGPDPIIREIVVECLGSDCPLSLYPALSSLLFEQFRMRLGSDGALRPSVDSTLFADCYFCIMRALFDRLTYSVVFTNEAYQMKLACQLYALSLPRSLESLKLRLRAIQCLVSFANKEALIIVQNQQQTLTQQLFMVVTHLFDYSTTIKSRQEAKILNEIETGGWRILLALFPYLPLHSSTDCSTDGVTKEATLEFFLSFFIDCLKRSQSETQYEHVCSVLRTILIANVRSGLPKYMSMIYDSDLKISSTFFKIVSSCTEAILYDHETDPLSSLAELVLREANLTIAICEACPSAEVDNLSELLLDVYGSAGRESDLLYLMIDHEIKTTDSKGDLFRRNCAMTKIYSVFTKRHGSKYLQETLARPMKYIMEQGDSISFELDPEKIPHDGAERDAQLVRNATEFQRAVSLFVDSICNSADELPPPLRGIARHVAKQVAVKYPGSEYTAVGAFVILRFISPAIIAPIGGENNLGPEAKRKLILICKVIQNLANNVFFKEPFMDVANVFLKHHIRTVTRFLHIVSKSTVLVTTVGERSSLSYTARIDLHRHLHANSYRIREELMKLRLVAGRQDRSDTDLQSQLTTYQTLLAHAGVPAKPLKLSSVAEQMELGPDAMENMSALHKAKIFYYAGNSRDGRPVLCYVPRRAEKFQVHVHLWTVFILSVMEPYWTSPFELFCDLTGHEFPVRRSSGDWISLLVSASPDGALANLMRSYWLNCSPGYKQAFDQVVVPRLHVFGIECIFLTVGDGLNRYFSLAQLSLPPSATIEPASLAQFQPGQILGGAVAEEVSLRVAMSIQALFVVHPECSTEAFSSSVVDFYPFADMEDIKVKPGGGAFEFRKRSNQKLFTFASPGASILVGLLTAERGPRFDIDDERMSRFDAPAVLLCAGIINVGSADAETRLASNQLINKLAAHSFGLSLPTFVPEDACLSTPAIRDISDLSQMAIANVPQADLLRLMLTFFNECLLRLPTCVARQQTYVFIAIQSWLGILTRKAALLQDSSNSSSISQIFLCLLRITCETRALRPLAIHVWRSLEDTPEFVAPVYETLSKFAHKYEHDSRQVSVVSDVLSSLRSKAIKHACLEALYEMVRTRHTLQPGSDAEDKLDKKLFVQLHIGCGATHLTTFVSYRVLAKITLSLSGIRNSTMQKYNGEILKELSTSISFIVHCREGGKSTELADDFRLGPISDYLVDPNDKAKTTTWLGFHQEIDRIDRLMDYLLSAARYLSEDTETSAQVKVEFHDAHKLIAFTRTPRQFRYRSIIALARKFRDTSNPPVAQLVGHLCWAAQQEDRTLDIAACLFSLQQTMQSFQPSFAGIALSAILLDHPLLSALGVRLLESLADLATNETFMMDAQAATPHFLASLENELGIDLKQYAAYGLTCILQDAWLRNTNEEIIKECLMVLIQKDRRRSGQIGNTLSNLAVPALAFLLTLGKSTDEMRSHFIAAGISEEIVNRTGESRLPSLLFSHAEIGDNSQALLLLSFLLVMLKDASQNRQLIIYRMLSEAAVVVPEVSALLYPAMTEQLQTILISSQNVRLLDVAQQLIAALVTLGMPLGDEQGAREELLDDLKFPYFGRRFSTSRFGGNRVAYSHLASVCQEISRSH